MSATISSRRSNNACATRSDRATLFRLVDDLDADERQVVVMRFAQRRSIREIAAEIGVSEEAVKQLQWRALRTLHARLTILD